MKMTADFHRRYSAGAAARAMLILRDPHAPGREYCAEQGCDFDRAADYAFTVGTLVATVGSLLDAMGYPEHGPDVDQRSWLPDPEDDDDV